MSSRNTVNERMAIAAKRYGSSTKKPATKTKSKVTVKPILGKKKLGLNIKATF